MPRAGCNCRTCSEERARRTCFISLLLGEDIPKKDKIQTRRVCVQCLTQILGKRCSASSIPYNVMPRLENVNCRCQKEPIMGVTVCLGSKYTEILDEMHREGIKVRLKEAKMEILRKTEELKKELAKTAEEFWDEELKEKKVNFDLSLMRPKWQRKHDRDEPQRRETVHRKLKNVEKNILIEYNVLSFS